MISTKQDFLFKITKNIFINVTGKTSRSLSSLGSYCVNNLNRIRTSSLKSLENNQHLSLTKYPAFKNFSSLSTPLATSSPSASTDLASNQKQNESAELIVQYHNEG